METTLFKYDPSLFSSWTPFYFILHERLILQLDKEQGKQLLARNLENATIIT